MSSNEIIDAVRKLREYAACVWFDESTATDEERELMRLAARALKSPSPEAESEKTEGVTEADVERALKAFDDVFHDNERIALRVSEIKTIEHEAMRAALESRLTAAEPQDKCAWLIELQGASPLYWGCIDNPEDGVNGWTPDVSKAIRFSRSKDAEAIIHESGWNRAFAVEHMWCEPRSSSPKINFAHGIEYVRAAVRNNPMGAEDHKIVCNFVDNIATLPLAPMQVTEAMVEAAVKEFHTQANTDFAAIIRAALSTFAQPWQPIETAPKDVDAEFLATDSRVFKGFPQVVYVDEDGRLTVKDTDVSYAREFFTHWMPLPSPPAQDREGK